MVYSSRHSKLAWKGKNQMDSRNQAVHVTRLLRVRAHKDMPRQEAKSFLSTSAIRYIVHDM